MSINRGRCVVCDCEIIKRDHLGNYSLLLPNYRNIFIVFQKDAREKDSEGNLVGKVHVSQMAVPVCAKCTENMPHHCEIYKKYQEIKHDNAKYYDEFGMVPVGFGSVTSLKKRA